MKAMKTKQKYGEKNSLVRLEEIVEKMQWKSTQIFSRCEESVTVNFFGGKNRRAGSMCAGEKIFFSERVRRCTLTGAIVVVRRCTNRRRRCTTAVRTVVVELEHSQRTSTSLFSL